MLLYKTYDWDRLEEFKKIVLDVLPKEYLDDKKRIEVIGRKNGIMSIPEAKRKILTSNIFLEFLNKFDLSWEMIYTVQFSFSCVDEDYLIHTDNTRIDPKHTISINIPIFGTEGTYVMFWEPLTESQYKKDSYTLKNGRTVIFHTWGDYSECKFIDKVERNEVCVVRTDIPHSVSNDKQFSLSLAVRVKKEFVKTIEEL